MTELLAALLPLVGALATLAPPLARRGTAVLAGASGASALVALGSAFLDGEGARVAAGYFTIDPTSRLFLALVTVIYFGIALYVKNRVAIAPALEADLPRFVRLSLLFMTGANLSVLSNHLALTWVFLEAQTLAATPLVHHMKGPASYRAAWRYLVFSTVGLSFTFLGFACLAKGMVRTGGPESVSFLVDELRTRAELGAPFWRRLGLLLMLFGYAAKLGLAPMYAWLPEVYETAPPSVTAMLSAIQATCVFNAIIRIMQVFRGEGELVSYELVGMGLASILVATVQIIGAKNYKKLIAFTAMAHNGIVAVGLGIGKMAAFGVVLYLFSNAFVKALLFLTCGNIKARYRTKAIADLKGLLTDMPVSGLSFMLGVFALLGFAPFGSFLGEVMILGGLVEGRHYAVFATFCALLTVVLISVGRSVFPMIWGEPRVKTTGPAETFGSIAPNLIYVAFLFSLGVSVPGPVNELFRQVAAHVAGK